MSRRKTTIEVIREFKNVHWNRYRYDNLIYINNSTKVDIECVEHGYFSMTPNNHLRGKGCKKCFLKNRIDSRLLSKDYVISNLKYIHGDLYDYSKVEYKNAKTKLIIICHEHGPFFQTFNTHLKGHGCPICGFELTSKYQKETPAGWTITNWNRSALKSKHFDSFKVYVIKCYNDTESFYKIGRTYTTTKRRFMDNYKMPYNYEVVKEFVFKTAKEAFNYENKLKRVNKDFKYLPKLRFDGQFECFTYVCK